MKILIFIFFSLFSFNAFALSFGVECVLFEGRTSCNDVIQDPTALPPSPPLPPPPTPSSGSCPTGRHWNADSITGVWFCEINSPEPPEPTVVKIPDSVVDPNPSKDDVACDPSKTGTTGDCASETTAKKANDLASETNSKLGSIANSSATSSGLLGKILDGIKGIGSGSGSSGSSSGSGSGSGSNSPPPDKPDAPSDPLTNDVKTVDFSQSMSSLGSCPSAISFNVLGKFYSISYQPLCDFAQGIRGVVITLGAFSALAVVVTAL